MMMKISLNNLYIHHSRLTFGNAKFSNEEDRFKQRIATVEGIVKKAASEQRRMSLKELREESGYTKKELEYVFNHSSTINTLWSQVSSSTRMTNEDRAKKLVKLKAILQEAKDNGIQMSLSELAQKTNLGRSAVNHYVSEIEELNQLWYWVKTKSPSSYTPEEVQKQIAIIKEQLTLAIEQKREITREELAAAADIEKSTVQNRIDSDETLTALREQTLAFEDANRKLEATKIGKVLKEAKTNGLKITLAYISNATSIPQSTVYKRIQQDTKLSALFKSVQSHEYNRRSGEEVVADDARIANVMLAAIKNEEKITQEEVTSRVHGLEKNITKSRLYNNPTLNALWKQVQKEDNIPTPADEIAAKIEKIKQTLTKLKNEGRKATLSEVADMTGMTAHYVHKSIKSSPALDVLWADINTRSSPIYTKEEIEVQNVLIERILKQRIEDKMIPTIYQMSIYLDLSRETVQQRIEDNPALLALYKKGQSPD